MKSEREKVKKRFFLGRFNDIAYLCLTKKHSLSHNVDSCMIRFLFFLFSLSITLTAPASPINLENEYSRLDDAIASSKEYIAIRQKTIDALERQLRIVKDIHRQYALCYKLYLLYNPYNHGQACIYLNRCINLAEKEGRKLLADHCRAELAKYLISSGFYDEASIYLHDIDTLSLDRRGWQLYYKACYALYGEQAFYATLPETRQRYERLKDYYERVLLPLLAKDDDIYRELWQGRLMSQGKKQEALLFNSHWMKQTSLQSHGYAMMALYRYLAYKALNDTTQMMYWVTQSVINDIHQGVTDQGAIWELANQLMLKGDQERAYRYISFASHCANTFGARQRKWQVAPLMASLADQYKKASEQSQQRLRATLWALSALFVVAIILLVMALKQRNHIRKTRNLLYISNQRLKDSIAQLADNNVLLADSNKVKEEYIGRFLEMCSLYVNRMDLLKKRTLRYLKGHKYGDLEKMIRGKGDDDEDAMELYKNFDIAFIHLFPHFVEDLNRLLRPEAQLMVEKDGQLSTSIRIFALIRLGICDSSKIAEFLHYSVNTIYNYRARVKKGAVGSKDDFENKVKMIGLNVQTEETL